MSAIQQPKVVVIGSGSLFFGRQAIWQMAYSPHLNQSTLALVDKDPARMEKMGLLSARRCLIIGMPRRFSKPIRLSFPRIFVQGRADAIPSPPGLSAVQH